MLSHVPRLYIYTTDRRSRKVFGNRPLKRRSHSMRREFIDEVTFVCMGNGFEGLVPS